MRATTHSGLRHATSRRLRLWLIGGMAALGGCTAMAGLDGDYVVGDTGSGSGTGGASSGTGGSSTSTSGEGGDGASASGSGGEGASTSSGTGGAGGSTSSGTGGSVFDGLDTGDVQLYYGQGSSNVPLLRTWDASTTNWLAPEPTVATNAPIRWVVTPEWLGNQHLVGVLSVPGGTQLDMLRNHSGTWTVDWSTTDIAVGNANRRGFDIAYETNSGEALVVYSDNTGNPKYRSLVGGSWTAEASVLAAPAAGVVQWIDLVARRPNSDEVALVFSDSARDLYAVIWDGSSWVARENLETHLHTIDYLAFGAAYEWSSGDLLVVWGHDDPNISGAVGFYTATKAAGSNTFQYLGIASAPLLRPGPIRLRSNRNTDRIACAYVEYTCGGQTCDDFIGAIWSGSQWTEAVRIDDYISVAFNLRPGAIPVDLAWLGNEVVALYTEVGNGLDWATWDTTNGWVLQPDEPTTPQLGDRVNIQGFNVAGTAQLLFLVSDEYGDLYAKTYDGSSWTDLGGALESDLSSLPAVPFAAAMMR